MGLSTEQVQILDLLRQVERTARNYPLVVWLARIAIKSMTSDDDERIDATEELERTYTGELQRKPNVTPLHRKPR